MRWRCRSRTPSPQAPWPTSASWGLKGLRWSSTTIVVVGVETGTVAAEAAVAAVVVAAVAAAVVVVAGAAVAAVATDVNALTRP